MKKWLILVFAFILIPVSALAVTEGVVESAPSVTVQIPEITEALFGVWEEGLSDIRLAAHNAVMSWADFPEDMKLEFLQIDNYPVDNDRNNDEILVRFVFQDEEDRESRVLVRYMRGTGRLMELSETMIEVENSSKEPPEAAVLTDSAIQRFADRYHAQEIRLLKDDDGRNAKRWVARFDSNQGEYEVCLDRRTGEVVRVSLSIGEVVD